MIETKIVDKCTMRQVMGNFLSGLAWGDDRSAGN